MSRTLGSFNPVMADLSTSGAQPGTDFLTQAEDDLARAAAPYLKAFWESRRNRGEQMVAAGTRSSIDDTEEEIVSSTGRYRLVAGSSTNAPALDSSGTPARNRYYTRFTASTNEALTAADFDFCENGSDLLVVAVVKPDVAAARTVVGSAAPGTSTGTLTDPRTMLGILSSKVYIQNAQAGSDKQELSGSTNVTTGDLNVVWWDYRASDNRVRVGLGTSGSADGTATWTVPLVPASGGQTGTLIGELEGDSQNFDGDIYSVFFFDTCGDAWSSDAGGFAGFLEIVDSIWQVV